MTTYMSELTEYNQILQAFDPITGVLKNLNLGDVDEHRKSMFEVISKERKMTHRAMLKKAD